MNKDTLKCFMEKWKHSEVIMELQLKRWKSNPLTWGLFAVSMVFPIALLIIYWRTTSPLTKGGYWASALRLIFEAYFIYYLVLIPLVLATSAFREEYSNQTAIYWLVSPVPRELVYLRKYQAFLTMSVALAVPSLIITTLIAHISTLLWDKSYAITTLDYLNNISILIFTSFFVLAGYGAVFLTIGVLLKNPLVMNLLIGFSSIFEQIFTDLINNEYEFTYIGINISTRLFTGFNVLFYNRVVKRYWLVEQSPLWGFLFGMFLIAVFLVWGVRKAPTKELL